VARRVWLPLVAFGAGAGLLVAAVSAVTTGAAAEARRGGTLRLGAPADLVVDPALAYTPRMWALEFATCAKLFNFADASGRAATRVIPEVVDRWAVSKDGKTYTFDLKRSFRFHTGAPVTARSFAAAFNRDANPRMESPATAYLREIVGANAVIAGKARTISGVRALAPYRLRIALTEPVGDFIPRLTMPFFCPLLPNTAINPAGIDNPPGSGPYFVAERIPNRRIVLRRNPFYRGHRPANVDEMVFTIGESADACWLATEQNRVDLCLLTSQLVPEATVRRIVRQYGINRRSGQFFVTPQLGTLYLAFNHDRRAFKGRGQIPLKKAINYALDRPALARAWGYLAARRTDQMLPPALGRDASVYPLRGADPATARRWLSRARFKPTRLVLYTWNNRFGVEFGQLLAFELSQIGIDVDVKSFEMVALEERTSRRGEPYDVSLHGWVADYADGAGFLIPLLSGRRLRQPGHSNFSYFDDPKTNARIEAAGRLGSAARRRAWAALDVDLMRTNPPWAPFIHGTNRAFVSRSFGCYLSHPVYAVDLAAACKK
jgi:ABC-type oligopeptide transport system substrate-binding subunit